MSAALGVALHALAFWNWTTHSLVVALFACALLGGLAE